MDFMVGLPNIRVGYNALWLIMDRLTKLSHFIPIKDNTSTNKLGKVYIREVVRLYGVLKTIVLNKDKKFVLIFWYSLQKSIGIRLTFNIT